MTRYRAPRWWQEILLLGFGYWLYGLVRNAVPQKYALAQAHGLSIQNLQDKFRLNFELSLNRFVANHEALAQVMDYYYATLHFVVTAAVLVWLYVAEGLVRATSDRGAGVVLAALEVALSLLVFAACGVHIRSRLRGVATMS